MHQLSRIAFDVPVLAAAQKGRRSALSAPKASVRAVASERMSPTTKAAAGLTMARGCWRKCRATSKVNGDHFPELATVLNALACSSSETSAAPSDSESLGIETGRERV